MGVTVIELNFKTMIQVDSPQKIYHQLQTVINDLVEKLNLDSQDTSTHQITNLGREVLSKLHDQINDKLAQLDQNAEWHTYTIALYGETNAGKSTIIETLRILLGEDSKKKQQLDFKQWQDNSGITRESIQVICQQIMNVEASLQQHKNKFVELQGEQKEAIKNGEVELQVNKRKWLDKKQSGTLLRRIIWLFKKPQEFRVYQESKSELEQATSTYEQLINQVNSDIESTSQDIDAHRHHHEKVMQCVQDAEPYSDGTIIGNGRSDFTLDTKIYTFKHDGCTFNVLDVPGIEGKESKVNDAIWQAVHKAHAVFYITSKASAPQKGDGKKPGTLDKIKQHLGAQSEVWTVFNKRIQNPIQIENRDLISEGEEESLQVLDTTMREYLGDSYQNHIALSAYPAFLAVASCLLPESRDDKMKIKFLSKFSPQQILEKSNISVMTNMLGESTVESFKEKLLRSNRNKAKEVVDKANGSIKELLDKQFSPLLNSLNLELDSSQVELTSHVATLRARLRNQARQELSEFETSVRKETYSEIDKDISNDEFKSIMRASVERSQLALIDKIPDVMNFELRQFVNKIGQTIDRFQAQVSDLVGCYNSLENTETNIEVDIDNGIDVRSILGILSGGAALFFTPLGWVFVAVSGLTLVFQLYKAVRSFFSSDYKKSQQRKSTDENLKRITKKIESKLEQMIDKAISEAENNVQTISEAMSFSIDHIRDVNKKLSLSQRELSKLSRELEY
ncbi:hypothetical protein [uncultured Ferrimonas sp.]|uniref:hypothetical protein n=1 Tax=uncultured Ferrimonas sp. TaxID=432640 RepID=UPI00262BDF1B|nr:hypothetical protein [uncultured Ferrimonas sp.]